MHRKIHKLCRQAWYDIVSITIILKKKLLHYFKKLVFFNSLPFFIFIAACKWVRRGLTFSSSLGQLGLHRSQKDAVTYLHTTEFSISKFNSSFAKIFKEKLLFFGIFASGLTETILVKKFCFCLSILFFSSIISCFRWATCKWTALFGINFFFNL